MELFDACYETLIVALMRYFAHTDENEADLIALQQASFFPMMTTVIRPLAECLTVLPAHEAGTATAGPSFTLARGLHFPPHRDAALQLILFLYDGLVERSQALSQQAADPNGPPELRPLADRLTQIYETLWRSRLNFAKAAGLKDANV